MDIDNIEQLFLLKLNNESIKVFKKMIGEKYVEKISSIQPKEGFRKSYLFSLFCN